MNLKDNIEIKEISLTDYIKSREFEDFQIDTVCYNEDFKEFKDELYRDSKFDELFQLEDIFLFQKKFYEEMEVYVVFPIIGKFIYEKAIEHDCSWCWDSKRDIGERVMKEFMVYLKNLIDTYEVDKYKE